MKAIILAGGLGERLRPLTDNVPKPLLPVKGKPIVQHAIENFKKHGIKDIVLSVGYRADKIKEYFGDGSKFGVKISYCVEDEPLGTGGAIKKASKGIKKTFIAINGDNVADFDWTAILKAHKKKEAIRAFKIGLKSDPTNKALNTELNHLGRRKKPLFPFLERNHIS